MRSVKVFTALLFFTSSTCLAQQAVLYHAHAHNDYKHHRPLLDALDNSFFSIEADVFYHHGHFIVAHTTAGIRKRNTIENLYLKPLVERVRQNGGSVYKDGPMEFELMVDLKGHWTRDQLDSFSRLTARYGDILTLFADGTKTSRAVKIVLSGHGTKYDAAAQNQRYFSIDGSFNDFNSPNDSSIICRTSTHYRSLFRWRGKGAMPEGERLKLLEYVSAAHATGRKIRFWGAPNKENVWRALLDAGVDWVNIDKLEKFRRFYTRYAPVAVTED